MTISISGIAKVEWTESRGKHSVTYTGSEELFDNSLVLSCTHEQIDYPFSLQIPNISALPWTTVTPHGYVEYGVKAVIKRPWYKLGNKKSKVLITVNSHISSRIVSCSKNSEYYTDGIISNMDLANAGFCCIPFCCWYLCSSEHIQMTLTAQSLWSYPGEDLHFTLEVDNTATKRELGNAKVQLVGVS